MGSRQDTGSQQRPGPITSREIEAPPDVLRSVQFENSSTPDNRNSCAMVQRGGCFQHVGLEVPKARTTENLQRLNDCFAAQPGCMHCVSKSACNTSFY